MLKKKSIGTDKKKFSLTEFVWLGFNYTVGISFIGACAGLSNPKLVNASGIDGIGMNIIWVYILEGFIAGICAWAFARIARAYKSSNNGGAYIYARGTFNKFVGLFVTFMLYVGMPFMITFQILMLIRGTFSPSYVTVGNDIPWYGFQWGVFGDLYLDLIGITIYIVSAVSIFLGIRTYKKMAHISAGVKWGAALFLIIAAIVLACSNGADNLHDWSSYTNSSDALQTKNVISTFNSCFYFFTGFEIFSTAGHNVKNPQKNIGRGVTIIMIVSTLFYALILVLFFAALPISEGFQQNETMSLWNKFKGINIVLYGGPILLIISSIALKINAAMQNSLYGGTMLQPMSVEGYFPDSWGKLDKDGLPSKASKINLLIVVCFVIIWLAIPDLIRGFSCQGHYNDLVKSGGKEVAEQWLLEQPAAFDVKSLTAASSTITISVYTVVLLCAMTMAYRKQLTLRKWEIISFCIAFVFMIFLFFYHYWDVAQNIVDRKNVTGGAIELTFVGLAIGFFVIWYFVYYDRKFHTRLKTNPQLQKKMDAEFMPIDDWSFTAITVGNLLKNKPYKGLDKAVRLLNEYIERNKAINHNTNNQNYREAIRFMMVLTRNISPLTSSLDKIAKRYSDDNVKQKVHGEIKFKDLTQTALFENIPSPT